MATVWVPASRLIAVGRVAALHRSLPALWSRSPSLVGARQSLAQHSSGSDAGPARFRVNSNDDMTGVCRVVKRWGINPRTTYPRRGGYFRQCCAEKVDQR